jgi:thiol-disulfide isomerase/thioredoxin
MKKCILLVIISLSTLHLVAQTKTVKIHGVVKDTTVKSIVLIYPADAKLSKWENTTLDLVNGTFSTSIQIPFPVEVSIRIRNRVYSKIFIYSDAEILIDAAGQSHISGSQIQDEYENEFLNFFHSNDQVRDSLRSWYNGYYQKYGNDFPELIKDSVNILLEKFYGERAQLLREYIKMHPNSYVALWDIDYLVGLTPAHKYVDFEKLFSSFSDQMQQQSFINVLKEKIKASVRLLAGQLFPEEFFKGHEQMQNNIRSNNRYYLIDFWYSHCVPCAKEFPKLKEIYSEFHHKGFDIISISVDKQRDENDYLEAIKKYKLSWNHVWDQDGVTAEKCNIHLFPTYFLLDKNGRIINPNIQPGQLEIFLKEKL